MRQILNKIVLMLDGRGLPAQEVIRELQARFRVSSVSTSIPIDHERSLAQIEATGETLVAVVSPAGAQQLRALEQAYPPLATGVAALDADPARGMATGIDAAGRAWIVIRAGDVAALRSALDAMQARRRL